MNDVLLESLKQAFPTVSDTFLKQMVASCVKIKEEAELFETYGQFAFRLNPRKLISFEEIEQVALLEEGTYEIDDESGAVEEKLFAAPKDLAIEELVLYYEGEDQLIPDGEDLIAYLFSKGYEVIPDPHPSLLIDAMAILTKEKLLELGVPRDVCIILPSYIENSFKSGSESGFLGIHRENYKGSLSTFTADKEDVEWDACAAFIVRKIK